MGDEQQQTGDELRSITIYVNGEPITVDSENTVADVKDLVDAPGDDKAVIDTPNGQEVLNDSDTIVDHMKDGQKLSFQPDPSDRLGPGSGGRTPQEETITIYVNDKEVEVGPDDTVADVKARDNVHCGPDDKAIYQARNRQGVLNDPDRVQDYLDHGEKLSFQPGIKDNMFG